MCCFSFRSINSLKIHFIVDLLAPTPIPLPTPPTAKEGYIPDYYWNTVVSIGFDAVNPLSNETTGPVSFTISKGETGIAMLIVKSVKALFPGASSTGKFNISFIFEELPEGVTVAFEPSSFTIEPEREEYVRMTITIDKEAKLKGKINITGRMVCVEYGTQKIIRTSIDFSIIVTTP